MDGQRFQSLDEALVVLNRVRAGGNATLEAPITLHQLLVHCAQSIECSMRGYPKMKPRILRAIVGPIVVGRFFRRGQMKHNHAAPVPGEPEISREGDLAQAWERLLSAIRTFQAFAEPPRDHFIFGSLSKAEYDRLHAMHLADHLSALRS